MNEKALKAAKRLLPIYRQTIDPWLEKALSDEKVKVSCKRGCHHCCYNLVNASLAEGAAIAAHLLEKGTFAKYAPQLEKTAKLADSVVDGSDDPSFRYLASKIPCAFLEDGECSIYDLRPAACRTYLVATRPENCSPDRPGAEVGYVDQRMPMGLFVNELARVPIPGFIGPFPSVVLAGKELVERSPGSFKRWAQKSPLFTSNVEVVHPDSPV